MGGVPTLTRKGDQAPSLPRLVIGGEHISRCEMINGNFLYWQGMNIPTKFSLTIHHLVQRRSGLALEIILFSKNNEVKNYRDDTSDTR